MGEEYKTVSITTSIKASSRMSVNIDKNYFTVEFTEERSVPQNCDLEKEREALWDAVNEEVDSQISLVYSTFRK